MRTLIRINDCVRVAIVAESFLPRVNGVTNSVIQVARNLRAEGIEVTIICADTYRDATFEDIPVRTVPSINVPRIHEIDVALTSVWWVSRILDEIRPDIVHVASPFVLGAVGIRAARRVGVPAVAVFQTDIPGFARHYGMGSVAPLADAHVRRIHQEADLTLAPSSASAQYLTSLGVQRVARWGRGVDTATFTPMRRDDSLRHAWLRSSGSRIAVGYLGRLAPEKGVNRLAHVSRIPGVTVVVIGDGPSRDELEASLPQAIFVGRQSGPELGRHVASLDVLVAPGENETFCQVIQEGMASGVPVIAPDVGGPRDLVSPGGDGFLYRPSDSLDLVEHVSLLVDDDRLRLGMGMNAFAKVSSRTWAAVTSDLLRHYESVAPTMLAA